MIKFRGLIYFLFLPRNSSKWIPAPSPSLVIPTELKLVSKVYESDTKCRYHFSLRAGDRIVIYIEPQNGNKIVDWSFNKTPLDEGYATPYFAYHVYSMDETPFLFWLTVEVTAKLL